MKIDCTYFAFFRKLIPIFENGLYIYITIGKKFGYCLFDNMS